MCTKNTIWKVLKWKMTCVGNINKGLWHHQDVLLTDQLGQAGFKDGDMLVCIVDPDNTSNTIACIVLQ